MGTYVKTTGDLVTVRPKLSSAANGGRMLLDDCIADILDVMLPVGELKTFATDKIDSWISRMAEYGQEWAVPDGSLLKVSDYPELFGLIGYNYGWSDTNPNGTYTHSFTDVGGSARSLTLPNDLDIDGNAKPVSGSPAYFRLPNFAGRFLRCAGTATYANKWEDTDGNEHEVLTTYNAEMYKGKLDAQRGISGKCLFILGGANAFDLRTGPFKGSKKIDNGHVSGGSALGAWDINFNSTYVTPDGAVQPTSLAVDVRLRII